MSVVAPFKQNLPHINSTLLRRTHKTLTLAFHKSRVFRPRVSVSGHYTIHPVDSLLISFMTRFYFIVFFLYLQICKRSFSTGLFQQKHVCSDIQLKKAFKFANPPTCQYTVTHSRTQKIYEYSLILSTVTEEAFLYRQHPFCIVKKLNLCK